MKRLRQCAKRPHASRKGPVTSKLARPRDSPFYPFRQSLPWEGTFQVPNVPKLLAKEASLPSKLSWASAHAYQGCLQECRFLLI
eukprot:1150807-Pelagomonas_calceolata.AAC.2